MINRSHSALQMRACRSARGLCRLRCPFVCAPAVFCIHNTDMRLFSAAIEQEKTGK